MRRTGADSDLTGRRPDMELRNVPQTGEGFFSAMTSGRGGIARRHDLDALRAFAMLLGIVLHGALMFLWPVPDEISQGEEDLLGLVIAWIHGFRMPLFFLMSGFFTAMLWRRRSLGSLLRQRALRVLLPLVLAMAVVVPMTLWTVGFIVESAAERSAGEVDPEQNVWLAAKTNDVAMLAAELAAGADVNAPDPVFRVTPLAFAALEGQTGMAGELLRRGAKLEAPNRDGSTALHSAAFMGRAETVRLLLDNGADVNALAHNGETPLDSAGSALETAEWLAGVLDLDYDERAARAGREQASALLAARGGERKGPAPAPVAAPETASPEMGAPETASPETENNPARDYSEQIAPRGEGKEDAWSGSAAPWYWRAVFSESLTLSDGDGGEKPFNLVHTDVFFHLWFLWFLLWLVGGFAVFAAVMYRVRGEKPLLPARLVLSPWLFVWAVPLTAAFQWFMGVEGAYPTYGPDTSGGLLPLPHVLLYYAVFFWFGAAYFDHNDGGERISRGWVWMLVAATVVVFPLGLAFTYPADFELGADSDLGEEGGLFRVLSALLQAAFPWLMTLGLMGLFRAVSWRGSYPVRYVSDSAYWLYIMHLPLAALAQYATRGLGLPALLHLGLVVVVVTGFLLLCYQGFVRYTPLGTLLNGRRTRPARSEAG